jgi:hypothetical protein
MVKKKHSPQRVARDNAKYEEWRKRNPLKEFKHYFAETVKLELGKGRAHPTLGGELVDTEFGAAGRGFLKRLLDCGLEPHDTCVDYGCGTLRIGVHVIDYLDPGGYWGFDVADFLLEQGQSLIGEVRWTEKQPRLRVISPESVAEVAAFKPKMLFSSSVLIHVHPEELPEYLHNVISIIGSGHHRWQVDRSRDHSIQWAQLGPRYSYDS